MAEDSFHNYPGYDTDPRVREVINRCHLLDKPLKKKNGDWYSFATLERTSGHCTARGARFRRKWPRRYDAIDHRYGLGVVTRRIGSLRQDTSNTEDEKKPSASFWENPHHEAMPHYDETYRHVVTDSLDFDVPKEDSKKKFRRSRK
jgi:hypothetical protein